MSETENRKNRKLKKEVKTGIIYGCTAAAGLAAILIFGGKGLAVKNGTSQQIKDVVSYRDDVKYVFSDTDASTVQNRISQNDTFVLMVGSEDNTTAELVPIVNEVAQRNNKNVDFINATKMKVEERNRLMDMLQTHISSEFSGSHYILFPSVLFVKEGIIEYIHQGTVPGHDSYVRTLTETERNELYTSLDSGFKYLSGEVSEIYEIQAFSSEQDEHGEIREGSVDPAMNEDDFQENLSE